MAFLKKPLKWTALGQEPSELKKSEGFKMDESPAPGHFDFMFRSTYEAIEELQQKAGEVKTVNNIQPDSNGNVSIPLPDVSKFYQKPTPGIPKADLDATVQASLKKADDAAPLTELAKTNQALTTHQADLAHVHWIGTATGTNTLTATYEAITALKNGLGVAFLNTTPSTGATTLNINSLGAIPILKANGNPVTNLKANGIYTLRYANGNFILQGEGGFGNATASDLLSGKTASTDAGDIVGTIPNKTTQTYTPGTTNQIITSGQYLSGTQTILGDPDLIPANILSGKNIFGVVGSLVQGKRWASGTATSSSGFSSVGTSNGTESMCTLSVNGLSLPFTPSIIIAIESTGVSYPAIYNSNPLINVSTENYYLYSKNFIKSPYFTVNSGGFSLPVSTGDKVYQWIAIE